jgi:hypothetical protein
MFSKTVAFAGGVGKADAAADEIVPAVVAVVPDEGVVAGDN